MHWADIKAAISKSGSSIVKIADKEGVPHQTVSGVIRGNITSHKVAYAISAITNIPTEKMWPGKYLVSPAEYKKLRGDKTRGILPTEAEPLKEAS